MSKMLFACALLIVVSTGAGAVLPTRPYVGLYADEAHLSTSLNPPVFTPFQLWIWWLPSEHGLAAAEYQMTFPSNVIQMGTAQNPLIIYVLDGCGVGEGGYFCPVFMSCQSEWVWTHRLTCMTLTLTPGAIAIGPSPYTTILQAFNCDPGYPAEPATILNTFGIYQDGVIGVEEQTWGTIKSLYR